MRYEVSRCTGGRTGCSGGCTGWRPTGWRPRGQVRAYIAHADSRPNAPRAARRAGRAAEGGGRAVGGRALNGANTARAHWAATAGAAVGGGRADDGRPITAVARDHVRRPKSRTLHGTGSQPELQEDWHGTMLMAYPPTAHPTSTRRTPSNACSEHTNKVNKYTVIHKIHNTPGSPPRYRSECTRPPDCYDSLLNAPTHPTATVPQSITMTPVILYFLTRF